MQKSAGKKEIVFGKPRRNIKIGDIDFENDLIRLQVTKNKKARFIPISSTLDGLSSQVQHSGVVLFEVFALKFRLSII